MKYKYLLAILSSVFVSATLLAASDSTVWHLDLKGGFPTDCKFSLARINSTTDKPSIDLDAVKEKDGFHSCITLKDVHLEVGKEYLVSVDYEVIDRQNSKSYFYLLARSNKLGNGADKWEKWYDNEGQSGIAKLRITPQSDDYVLTVGIRDQAAIRIRGMKIKLGNGWTSIPLDKNYGDPRSVILPTGAKDFTIDAPHNPQGAVVNLADFGIISNLGPQPDAAFDRNLAALNAALTKCREINASKLIVPKGVYRITSGQSIVFEGLNDFIFDGGGATFLFDKIKGGPGILIKNCNRIVFTNYNLDWDCVVDPIAFIGQITATAPTASYFEMRFDSLAPLDKKQWVTTTPLDEKTRTPGYGKELSRFIPDKLESIDPHTVRVWKPNDIQPEIGQWYILRHYTYEKMGIIMKSNTHLLLKDVNIYSFPGSGFVVSGDQHHFELLHCGIKFPDGQRRAITTATDGLHVDQSQGFIKMEDCDFGYMGDDCVNIHDNIHHGVRRVDAHTLVATNFTLWRSPFAVGDTVEIRNGDYSPTGFTGRLTETKLDSKNKEMTLVFEQELPVHIVSDAMLFNHRYNSHNCIIRNCYFHENRCRAILCNTPDWLIEGNKCFHNQYSGLHLVTDIKSWAEGFGAQNVIIRNNQFNSENSIGRHEGAAIYISADVNGSHSHYHLMKDILLENNTIQEMTGPAVEAFSFQNLIIRNNKIINRELLPLVLETRGAIRTEDGGGLCVIGNQWDTRNEIAEPSILFDAETSENIMCRGNVLKK